MFSRRLFLVSLSALAAAYLGAGYTDGVDFRRVVQPLVRAAGEGVMIDGGFDEVAGGVTLVIAAAGLGPAFLPPAVGGSEGPGRLQVAVGFLGGEDFGNPVVQGGFHSRLGRR